MDGSTTPEGRRNTTWKDNPNKAAHDDYHSDCDHHNHRATDHERHTSDINEKTHN